VNESEAVTPEHITDVRICTAAWQIGSSRYVATCECGWRGIPHMVNKPGRRAAFREAAVHQKAVAQ
jgi:hypothetical protein